jgi:hypothetical protein
MQLVSRQRRPARENEAILGSMSEAEILEEQRQVREELGLSEGLIRLWRAFLLHFFALVGKSRRRRNRR